MCVHRMVEGRHLCDCMAAKHKLIGNCLACGRIVCAQEGSGPCLFCGDYTVGVPGAGRSRSSFFLHPRLGSGGRACDVSSFSYRKFSNASNAGADACHAHITKDRSLLSSANHLFSCMSRRVYRSTCAPLYQLLLHRNRTRRQSISSSVHPLFRAITEVCADY